MSTDYSRNGWECVSNSYVRILSIHLADTKTFYFTLFTNKLWNGSMHLHFNPAVDVTFASEMNFMHIFLHFVAKVGA